MPRDLLPIPLRADVDAEVTCKLAGSGGDGAWEIALARLAAAALTTSAELLPIVLQPLLAYASEQGLLPAKQEQGQQQAVGSAGRCRVAH